MQLRANWDAVYEDDPEAQFFLSSTFMADWLQRLRGPWFILAAKLNRTAAAYDAFFPLRLRTKERRTGGFYNDINMAGNYGADYTGFICRPEGEEQLIPGFARFMRQLNWTHCHLEWFRVSPRRLELFMAPFKARQFDADPVERINEKDNVNNCICPYAELPGDWERYLDSLSSNTRQKIRRFLRQVETSGDFRITLADEHTVDRDVKFLLSYWATKWAPRKGSRTAGIVRSNYATLMGAFKSNALFLPMLWKGDRPLGALASFIDYRKKSLLFYIAGRDETWNSPPSGLVLHAHSIRFAIENGFSTYDFLRGNEPYKYSFGAKDFHINCVRISTKNRRNLGDRLDQRCLPGVLKRAIEHHKDGKIPQAERGYRQILDVAPRHPKALYCLGQLMVKEGRFALAKKMFKKLVAVKPDAFKAWLGLATTLHAMGRFADAEGAYREAIERQPGAILAYRNLGSVLLKLGRPAEAATVFRTVLALQPDDQRGKNGLARALDAIDGASTQRDHRTVPNGSYYGNATAGMAEPITRLH